MSNPSECASQRADVLEEELEMACETVSLDHQLLEQPAPRLQCPEGKRPHGWWQQRIHCSSMLRSANDAARQRVLRGLLRKQEQDEHHKPRHREDERVLDSRTCVGFFRSRHCALPRLRSFAALQRVSARAALCD